MIRYGSLVLSLGLALAVAATPARAQEQEHMVDRADLRASASSHAEAEDARRETVIRVLRHPEVRQVANRMGVDMRTAEDAVATLEGPELERLAGQASEVEEALVGGHTYVTISVTALIIALLVLLILLVA